MGIATSNGLSTPPPMLKSDRLCLSGKILILSRMRRAFPLPLRIRLNSKMAGQIRLDFSCPDHSGMGGAGINQIRLTCQLLKG